MPEKQIYEVDEALYRFDDPRVISLEQGEMTQLEFMRLTAPQDPWEISRRGLKVIDKDMAEERKKKFKKGREQYLTATGGLTGGILFENQEIFKRVYPEIADELGLLVIELTKENCAGCEANKRLKPMIDKILAADPVGRVFKDCSTLDSFLVSHLKGEKPLLPKKFDYPPQLLKVYPQERKPGLIKPSTENMRRITAHPKNSIWDRKKEILEEYPDLEEEWRGAEERVNSASCTSCERRKAERVLRGLIAALKKKAPLPPLSKALSLGSEETFGPRPSCLDCARKHIGQAIALFVEASMGYPQHKWLAIGHLAEAEAETLSEHRGLSSEIRTARLLSANGEHDLMPLFELIDEEQGEQDSKKTTAP